MITDCQLSSYQSKTTTMEKYFYPSDKGFCIEYCRHVDDDIKIGSCACASCSEYVCGGIEDRKGYIVCRAINKARGIELEKLDKNKKH